MHSWLNDDIRRNYSTRASLDIMGKEIWWEIEKTWRREIKIRRRKLTQRLNNITRRRREIKTRRRKLTQRLKIITRRRREIKTRRREKETWWRV